MTSRRAVVRQRPEPAAVTDNVKQAKGEQSVSSYRCIYAKVSITVKYYRA
jgi:hypothetical protein